MAKSAIGRAVVSGRLFEVHPRVYSVIPPELMTEEARHAAAILAGGKGACLCGPSNAWWHRLSKDPPPEIHVAVAGPRKRIPGIRWHRLNLRDDERTNLNNMPVTVPERIPLDMAADSSLWELKGLLAELEFHYDIGPEVVARSLRRGFAGAARLRQAIAEHTPQLAQTREELERTFAQFLVECGFELPEFNRRVGKSTVDAAWLKYGVVAELDGVKGHRGERRILRDHRRDLHRRADGLVALRYHYGQIMSYDDRLLIEAELERLGIPRIPGWPG